MRDDQREKRDRKTTRRKGLTRKREKREREKEQGVSTSKVRPLLFHIAFI